jgi:hypothetical protein
MKRDLKVLHRFLKDQGERPSLTDVWSALCRLRRRGSIQILFFWPEFFRWLAKSYNDRAFLAADWVPGDLAIEFLAEEYGASAETIRRLVRSNRGSVP